MRFTDLTIGQEFLLGGMTYRKTSPILATDAEGKSRMIPRSAEIQISSTVPVTETPANLSDLEQFYQTTLNIIRQQVGDVDLMLELRQAIDQAYRRVQKDKI